MLKTKKYFFSWLFILLISNIAVADVSKTDQSARTVVANFQAKLLDTMKQGETLDFEGRYKNLSEPVINSHDLTKITRIVVGREWKTFTDEQKKALVKIFARLSIASYAHNFKGFSGEEFKFDAEETTPRGGVIVHTLLKIPDEKDVKLDYQMKKQGDDWRIINIIANGVSDLALKRSEYTSILKREGFDALLAKISDKIKLYSSKK
jgi:phospholipid transport system substrate-binding protein